MYIFTLCRRQCWAISDHAGKKPGRHASGVSDIYVAQCTRHDRASSIGVISKTHLKDSELLRSGFHNCTADVRDVHRCQEAHAVITRLAHGNGRDSQRFMTHRSGILIYTHVNLQCIVDISDPGLR